MTARWVNGPRDPGDGRGGHGVDAMQATPAGGAAARWRARVRWWVSRYGLAEVAGTCGAMLAAWSVDATVGGEVVAAYAAAFAETAGYYGVVLAREVREAANDRRRGGIAGGPQPLRLAGRMRRLVMEFGPAEAADLFFIRPAAMGVGTWALGRELGVPAGKLLADAVFYAAVIAAYKVQHRATRAGTAG